MLAIGLPNQISEFIDASSLSVPLQRKVPDQDIAQGSYIALPLTLLLLLAAYNHEKVPPQRSAPHPLHSKHSLLVKQ